MPGRIYQTVDPRLNEFYARMAEGGAQFQGWTVQQYRTQIKKLVERTQSTDLLDYGSGQGLAWPKLAADLGVNVCKYDPSIPRLARKPQRAFHGVICTDVLEHIPEGLVDNVIAELFEYAQRFLFVTTCPRPAKKLFEDGTNMHVTVKPAAWWLEKLAAANTRGVLMLHRETP